MSPPHVWNPEAEPFYPNLPIPNIIFEDIEDNDENIWLLKDNDENNWHVVDNFDYDRFLHEFNLADLGLQPQEPQEPLGRPRMVREIAN